MARVTVVNDNPDFLDLVGDLLGELNYETTLVDGDRPDAIVTIAASDPDVLIVDLRMGSDALHGWDVAQQVRAEPTLDGLPILVCSADREALDAIAHKYNHYKLTGDRPQTWTALHVTHPLYAARRLQFYPLTATGFMNILVRKYPLPSPAIQWGWSDIMHLDRSMLEEATAFVMLSVDAINADAANVCKSMMEARYIDIVSALGSRPMHIKGTSDIPDQWYVTR